MRVTVWANDAHKPSRQCLARKSHRCKGDCWKLVKPCFEFVERRLNWSANGECIMVTSAFEIIKAMVTVELCKESFFTVDTQVSLAVSECILSDCKFSLCTMCKH